jgi:hypothetical protein
MYHTIRFTADIWVDLEVSPKQSLERLLLRAGDRVPAQLKPYVVETRAGPVEVADLYFADRTASRRVPFAYFSLVD